MNYLFALLLIGLAILFHEFGHFMVARRVNIPIKIFSIGFGPVLWKKQWKGTEYRLSWFPFGGYVLPDIEDESQFFQIPALKRVAMAAGGPLASLLLPILCIAAMNFKSAGFSMQSLLIEPVLKTWTLSLQMILSLSQLFSAPGQLSGVIGMVAQGGHYVAGDPHKALQFLALMSLNLFIINLLPIPAFDGGKILLFLTEKIHPSFVKLHIPLSIAGWILIAGLTLYTAVTDIQRFMV